MSAEFIADNGTSMRDQGTNDVLLESECKVKVGPSFVAVLNLRKTEDEIVHVLDIPLSLTFVTQTEHHTCQLDMC